jgi:hypothetical protein
MKVFVITEFIEIVKLVTTEFDITVLVTAKNVLSKTKFH